MRYYNEELTNRLREALAPAGKVEEKVMFSGTCFMLNDKMCMGVIGDEMMCRIDPDIRQEVLEKPGCRPMEMGGREMKGYVIVEEPAFRSEKDFRYWVDLCLAFNPKAKSSKEKKRKAKRA